MNRRTLFITAITGIMMITIAGLGFVQSRQSQEKDGLASQLAMVEKRLEKLQFAELVSKETQLQAELSQVTSQIKASQKELHTPQKTIELTEALFKTARDSSVQVASFNVSGPATDTVGGVSLPALKVTIKAAGKVSDLIKFVVRLNGDIRGGLVKSVQVSVLDGDSASAEIQMAVYEYKEG